MNPAREKVRHISLDEEHLYMQSSGGVTTAFDNETGKRLWAVQLGRRDLPSYPAVSNGDQVLIVNGIQMFVLDKFTGEIQWEIRLPKQPSTSPAMDDRKVYVGMLDGSIFAFDIMEQLVPNRGGKLAIHKIRSVIDQQYVGNINILPDKQIRNLMQVVANPTLDSIKTLIESGERATWPQLDVIRRNTLISETLRNKLRALKQREARLFEHEPV